MRIIKKIIYRLTLEKVVISRGYLNLFGTTLFFLGAVFSSFLFATNYLIPIIFAATSPWTQTDWSGGTASGTVTGTVTTYSSSSNIDVSTVGEFSLTEASGWSSTYSDWTKRQVVTVTNSGSSQTDYQVKLSITYDSDMQSDFDDLRFSNSSGTALDYWLQSKTDSTSAVVWVEVDSLAGSGDTTIHMYYGNSGVSSGSNGENTFMLFDDFDDGTLDTNKWTEVDQSPSGEIYESGGKLNFVRLSNDTWNKTVYGVTTYTRADISFEMDYTWTNNNSVYDALMMGWHDNTSGTSYTNLVYGYYNSGSGTSTTPSQNIYEDGSSRGGSLSWTLNQDYDVRIRMRSSGGAYYDFSTDSGSTWTNRYTSSYSTESNLRPGWAFYSGTHEFDNARIRKWMSSEPTSSFGSEVNKHESSGTVVSNILDAEFAADWGTLSFTTSGSGTVTVKVRTDSNSDMSGATDWGSCTGISSASDISSNGCVTDTDQYLQYQVTLAPTGGNTPTFEDISIAFTASDQVAPTTNASGIAMYTDNASSRSISSGGYNNSSTPYFTWTAGADNSGGGGLRGYCIYLGTTSSSDPSTTSGLLTNTPVSTSDTTCGFVQSGTSLDLSAASYLSSSLSAGTTYYVYMKAVDSAGNVFSGASVSFSFIHDGTAPTNVAYVSTPGSTYSNVADMFFTWPTSGGSAASDSDSGLLGYQYQINSTAGTWLGTQTDSACGISYIPSGTGTRTLTDAQDSSSVSVGNNVVYFRTVDVACSPSDSSSYRTGNLDYGGAAPSFGGGDSVTVTPSTSTDNSFSLSWPTATATSGQSITNYYYMVNTTPPSALSTLTGNSSTYVDNSTTTTVSTGALTNVNKGSNTVYVVAVDDANNYSPSNYVTGSFTLNSTDPDNAGNLVASDSSIKAQSQWNVTLTWTAPDYLGAGNLTYLVYRSSDGSSFSQVGTTTGLSYVDNTSSSDTYYYKIYSQDGASAKSSGTNAVSIAPTGKWTSAPSLDSGPSVGSITTKKATVTWSTSRTSDSKVQYGTSSGSYNTEEPSNSSQVSSHSITLTGLLPGTTYYYKAKWTDEDGNTGTSDEKTFTTSAAPTVKDVSATSIGLTSAVLKFTSKDASKVKIYYGKTTSYGGVTEVTTGTSESSYTVQLTGLDDGTKYYYKINTFDSEDEEYEGTILNFETLPRPKISSVRIQQVKDSAQPTMLITWKTNTKVSSIVTYYPEGSPSLARDEVNVALVEGEHKMLIKDLNPSTSYSLFVKGRDKLGNEAISDVQRITTATDTRPPAITNLRVEGGVSRTTDGREATTQLTVTWDSDESSTSQVEFSEGTGATYSQKSQEDSNLTKNHLVIISGLTPSKVYHLRVLSKDSAGNIGSSVDTVTITPKATKSALNIVVQSLSEVFGFLGGL